MPLQQHLYNGLAHDADYSILCGNRLARTDRVLAYGQRGLFAGEPMLAGTDIKMLNNTDNRTTGQTR